MLSLTLNMVLIRARVSYQAWDADLGSDRAMLSWFTPLRRNSPEKSTSNAMTGAAQSKARPMTMVANKHFFLCFPP